MLTRYTIGTLALIQMPTGELAWGTIAERRQRRGVIVLTVTLPNGESQFVPEDDIVATKEKQ